jgi:hypothetical protein
MATSESDETAMGSGTGRQEPDELPRFVDWLVAGVIVLIGLALVVGGWALFGTADPEFIAQLVEDGVIQSDVFSGQELVDVTVALAWWGGIGLLVAGVGTWLAAVAFLILRRRERRRAGSRRSVVTNAIVGAVASAVLAFVPLSQIAGGAVAGYLQRGSRSGNLTAGGLSALFAVLPAVVVVAFVVVGLVEGAGGATEFGGVALVGAFSVVVGLFAVLFTVALGALGGFVGGELVDRSSGDR